MIRWLARFLLLRVLPRRLLPILTVIEVIRFVRRLRGERPVKVNSPLRSRTAPPPPPVDPTRPTVTP